MAGDLPEFLFFDESFLQESWMPFNDEYLVKYHYGFNCDFRRHVLGMPFYPERTLIFHPICPRSDQTLLLKTFNLFGEVAYMKLLFAQETGCAVVVYRNVGGVYSAINCLTRPEWENTELNSFLTTRFLWALDDFKQVELEARSLYAGYSDENKYRNILIPTGNLSSQEILERMKFFGTVQQVFPIVSQQGLLFRITFQSPLDAITSAVCIFERDMKAGVCVGDRGEMEICRTPWCNTARCPHDPERDERNFITASNSLSSHVERIVHHFRNPTSIYLDEELSFDALSIRIPVVENTPSNLILEVRKGVFPKQFVAVNFDSTLYCPDGIVWQFQGAKEDLCWVSFFYLELSLSYCPHHSRFFVNVITRNMNHAFSIMHQDYFEQDRINFAFATTKPFATSVPSEYATRARYGFMHYMHSRGRATTQWCKPYKIITLPEHSCCTDFKYSIPVVIISETMPL